MLSHGLEFFVEHVMEPSEGPLLDAAGQSPAEEPFPSLFSPDIQHCRMNAGIAIEICQLEASLYDIEWVGEQRACQSRQ